MMKFSPFDNPRSYRFQEARFLHVDSLSAREVDLFRLDKNTVFYVRRADLKKKSEFR